MTEYISLQISSILSIKNIIAYLKNITHNKNNKTKNMLTLIFYFQFLLYSIFVLKFFLLTFF